MDRQVRNLLGDQLSEDSRSRLIIGQQDYMFFFLHTL